MPLLTQEKAIKEYYEEVKDKYPDINFDRFFEICRNPGEYIKQCIRSTTMPFIRVKYLGLFRVFPAKIKRQINKFNPNCLQRGIITQEMFDEKQEFLKEYLNDVYEYDQKFPSDSEGQETTD